MKHDIAIVHLISRHMHAWNLSSCEVGIIRRRKLQFRSTTCIQKHDVHNYYCIFPGYSQQICFATSQMSLACKGMCVWRSLPYCGVTFGSFGFCLLSLPLAQCVALGLMPGALFLDRSPCLPLYGPSITAHWLCHQGGGGPVPYAVLIFCLVS